MAERSRHGAPPCCTATRPLCMLRRCPCCDGIAKWLPSLYTNLAVKEEDKQRSAGQADKVGNLRGDTRGDQ